MTNIEDQTTTLLPEIRESFARYSNINLIGSGGFGAVYKAFDPALGRYVAIKVLQLDVLRIPEMRERFLREARLLSVIRHPNVVQIYSLGLTVNGYPYISMEYLEGRLLTDMLAEKQPLSFSEAKSIFIQILCAVEGIHSSGVLHRDLKPSNFMLVPEGNSICVKLIDFGLAKGFAEDEFNTKLTLTGVVCGTPAYMSPEQWATGQPSIQSDIYSLGCTLYECFTGRSPFVVSSNMPADWMLAHLLTKPQPVFVCRQENFAYPDLELLLTTALAKDPKKRFQTIQEFKRALEDCSGITVDAAQYQPPQVESQNLDAWPYTKLSPSTTSAHGIGATHGVAATHRVLLALVIAISAFAAIVCLSPQKQTPIVRFQTSRKMPLKQKDAISTLRHVNSVVDESVRFHTGKLPTIREFEDLAAITEQAISQIPESNRPLKLQAHLVLATVYKGVYLTTNNQNWLTGVVNECQKSLTFARDDAGKANYAASCVYAHLANLLDPTDPRSAKYYEQALRSYDSRAIESHCDFVLEPGLPAVPRANAEAQWMNWLGHCYRVLGDDLEKNGHSGRAEHRQAENWLQKCIHQSLAHPPLSEPAMRSTEELCDLLVTCKRRNEARKIVLDLEAVVRSEDTLKWTSSGDIASKYTILSDCQLKTGDVADALRLSTLATDHLDSTHKYLHDLEMNVHRVELATYRERNADLTSKIQILRNRVEKMIDTRRNWHAPEEQ